MLIPRFRQSRRVGVNRSSAIPVSLTETSLLLSTLAARIATTDRILIFGALSGG